jgi:hypothetical protein
MNLFRKSAASVFAADDRAWKALARASVEWAEESCWLLRPTSNEAAAGGGKTRPLITGRTEPYEGVRDR